MVAERLDRRLRENVRDARSSLFSGETLAGGQYAFQRPLLVVLDRNMDLATPLHHTWTYQVPGAVRVCRTAAVGRSGGGGRCLEAVRRALVVHALTRVVSEEKVVVVFTENGVCVSMHFLPHFH